MRMSLWAVFGLAIVAELAACNRGSAALEARYDDPMVLRAYVVGPDKAAQIRDALASVLMAPKEEPGTHARVSQLADGRLLVLAPITLQASVSEVLKSLDVESADHAPGIGTSVRMQYWLVEADGALAQDDPATAPLKDALEAARPALGAVHFRVHDSLSLTANPDGEMATAISGLGTLAQNKLRPASGGVRAGIQLRAQSGGSLDTTATVPFDQTLVLAAIGSNAPGAPPKTRLYVIRAERIGKA